MTWKVVARPKEGDFLVEGPDGAPLVFVRRREPRSADPLERAKATTDAEELAHEIAAALDLLVERSAPVVVRTTKAEPF